MQRVLLVSATPYEIQPTIDVLDQIRNKTSGYQVCITGVGMVNTAFELGKLAGGKFDLVINAGIAGSFGRFAIGNVVNVTNDCFSELGAENDKGFISIDDLGFGHQKVNLLKTFENNFTKQIPKAWGITVNTTHGNSESIKRVLKGHAVDVETMEGAAFIHAANALGWNALQLRAISNLVEKRDKNKWNIPLAIERLNTTLIELLRQINEH